MHLRPTTLIVIVAVLLASTPAWAQPGAQMSPADRQDVLSFVLTQANCTTIIDTMGELSQYALSRSPMPAWIRAAPGQPRSAQIAALDADAGAAAILKRRGISSRDYTVGLTALRMALWKTTQPTSRLGSTAIVSDANLAFMKTNAAAIKAKYDAAEAAALGRR